MVLHLTLVVLVVFLTSCTNPKNHTTYTLVGGACEGCEAVLEFGDRKLTSIDTLPDFYKEGTKIKVKGTIYQNDGETPAENVIVYVYHTNQEGIYTSKEDAKGWGKKHGYNRAWLKTDKNGNYAFYSLKPAPYPNRTDPAHIHYIILEPNGKYYYIQSCHFKGDSLLSKNETNPEYPRGGTTGVLNLKREGKLLVGTRDVILGSNIPNYE